MSTHGTSAYAIGLKVDDAAATVARASGARRGALRAAARTGRDCRSRRSAASAAASSISSMPASSSTVWEVEFVPVGRGRPRPMPGSLAIDHVAQTMNYDEMLTWMLFYTSIFETAQNADGRYRRSRRPRAQPGHRECRGLAAADAQRRRESPDAGRPFHRRNLRLERPASGFAHAPTSSPRRSGLRQAGFRPLAISPNYFDDLEARFGLSAGRRRAAARPATSSTTATTAANSSSSTVRPTARASSSRSSSAAAATQATARRTPRSASPRRSVHAQRAPDMHSDA